MEEGKTPDRSPERGSNYPKKIKGRGLLGSSGIVSAFTMLSRILGLLRDVVLARVIGAGAPADVFLLRSKYRTFSDVYFRRALSHKPSFQFWGSTENEEANLSFVS